MLWFFSFAYKCIFKRAWHEVQCKSPGSNPQCQQKYILLEQKFLIFKKTLCIAVFFLCIMFWGFYLQPSCQVRLSRVYSYIIFWKFSRLAIFIKVFDTFWFKFCGDVISLFYMRVDFLLASFVQKINLLPLNCLYSSIKDQLNILL